MQSLVRRSNRDLERWPLDAFFDRFFETEVTPMRGTGWYPAMDLVEEKDRLVARIELPGVDAKSVDINLQGDVLSVSGERNEEKESSEGRVLSRETTYGKFTRSVRLPYRVEANKVKAHYEHGILSISMPKAEEFVGRQIPVEVK